MKCCSSGIHTLRRRVCQRGQAQGHRSATTLRAGQRPPCALRHAKRRWHAMPVCCCVRGRSPCAKLLPQQRRSTRACAQQPRAHQCLRWFGCMSPHLCSQSLAHLWHTGLACAAGGRGWRVSARGLLERARLTPRRERLPQRRTRPSRGRSTAALRRHVRQPGETRRSGGRTPLRGSACDRKLPPPRMLPAAARGAPGAAAAAGGAAVGKQLPIAELGGLGSGSAG